MTKHSGKYFRKGDPILYGILFVILGTVALKAFRMKPVEAGKAEIWVAGKLEYVLPLKVEESDLFVDTPLGGVNVKFKDRMVRVTSSNSPLKLCVKQGWIKNPGETIIGVPDKLVIKIAGAATAGQAAAGGDDNIDIILK